MNDFNRSIAQILLSFGIIENNILLQYINELQSDFPHLPVPVLNDAFHTINYEMRNIGMEIRSLIILDDNGNRVRLHGIANMDDDFAAKTYGSEFNASELQFFKDLCLKLVDERHLSTHDILVHKKNDWSNIDTERFLFRLHEDKWLEKDKSNYWELGPRTHLELRSVIENAIRAGTEDEEMVEERINELPQILFY